jgi:hypothetical protein
LIAAAIVHAPPAARGAADFAFTVNPAAIVLARGQEGAAVVLLQNTGTTPLENVRISSFSNPPMQITIEPTENQTIPPKATAAWKAAVSREASSGQAGTVFFRADFTRAADQGGSTPFPVTVVASLTVTNQPVQKVEDLLEVKCETVTESLNEKRPAVIYLRLKSRANVPLEIGPVTITCPSSITVAGISLDRKMETALTPSPGASPGPIGIPKDAAPPSPSTTAVVRAPIDSSAITLQPFEISVLGFVLKAATQVTPGKQLIAFEIPVQWKEEGKTQSASQTVTQSIDVGVFGETAVLAAIGIPTFLFLPGFLALMTFAGLWKLSVKSEDAKFPLKASTAEFYVVAITISILAFWLYPILTQLWTTVRRDFTESYGLIDVVWVWLGSITLGAFAFFLFVVLKWAARVVQRMWQARVTFAPGDKPVEFLEKLARRKLGLTFDRFSLTEGDKTIQGFIIEADTDPKKNWVAPEMVMDWTGSDMEAEKSAVKAIEKDDAKAAARILKTAQANRNVSLMWSASGTLNAPQLLQNVSKSGARGRIVRSASA